MQPPVTPADGNPSTLAQAIGNADAALAAAIHQSSGTAANPRLGQSVYFQPAATFIASTTPSTAKGRPAAPGWPAPWRRWKPAATPAPWSGWRPRRPRSPRSTRAAVRRQTHVWARASISSRLPRLLLQLPLKQRKDGLRLLVDLRHGGDGSLLQHLRLGQVGGRLPS